MCEKCNNHATDCECNLTHVQQNTDNVFFGIDINDKLPNLNMNAGVDLTSIIKKIDYKLGSITNSANYGSFNVDFLNSKYTVNTVKKFSESVSLEMAYNNARVNQLLIVVGQQGINTSSLTSKVDGIKIPEIIDSSGVGFTVNDNINIVLQKIVNKFNNLSIPSKLLNLSSTDSDTLSISLSGASNSNFKGDVKISNLPNNILRYYNDGLYVAKSATNSSQTLSIKNNQLSISGDGGNTIPIPISGLQTLQRTGNKIYISGGNDITLPDTIETSLVANSSTSINFTQTGTTGHNITANLRLSSVDGNLASVSIDGLYIKTNATEVLKQIALNTDLKTKLCDLVSNCSDSASYTWYIRNTSTSPVTIQYIDINNTAQELEFSIGPSSGTINGLRVNTFPSSTLTITFLGNVRKM